jgi:hypothetical protein
MPVHPVLAEILADWRAKGWARMMEREPGEEDLVVPCPKREKFPAGRMRDKNYSRKRLAEDLDALKRRHRRGHDLRRTMISLAQEDGADRFKLEVCTHTPGNGRTAIGMYTTYQWPCLCAEVAKLNIARPVEQPPTVSEPPTVQSTTNDAPPADAEIGEIEAALTTVLTTIDSAGEPEPGNSLDLEAFWKAVGVEAPGIDYEAGGLSTFLRGFSSRGLCEGKGWWISA